MSYKIYCQHFDQIDDVQEYHYQFFKFLFVNIDPKQFLKKSTTPFIHGENFIVLSPKLICE